MHVYQRKGPDGSLLSPFWYYNITVDGKRVRVSTKERVKTKAQRVMVDALRDAEAEAKAGPKVPTLRDAMLAYAADLRARGRNSYDADKLADKTFAQGAWASRGVWGLPPTLRVDELTEDHTRALKAARRREGYKPGTVSQELSKLRSAVILSGVRVPGLRWNIEAAPGKTRWLSQDEWQRVYDTIDIHRPVTIRGGHVRPPGSHLIANRLIARDLFVALTMCGGRRGEVLRLAVDQVLEGSDGVVRIRLYGWKTKKERLVPAPPVMAEMLVRRLHQAVEAGSSYLFHRGGEWVRTCRIVTNAFDRAGLNEPHIVERQGKATLHSLRHTFASWLRQAGLSLAEIQELLGHEAEAMTKRYAHIAPHATVDLASRILTGIMAQVLPAGHTGGTEANFAHSVETDRPAEALEAAWEVAG